MKTTYIYGIRDLETNQFIYVGKSNEPKHRYNGLNNSHNDCIRVLVERKGEENFQVEALEKVAYEVTRDWGKREKFWVRKLRKEGHPLCNKNDGGGGPTEHTEEWKRKASERSSGENAPWYGKHLPEEVKAKISKSKKGKKHSKPKSEETKLKLSKALTGREITWGDKISQALTGRKVSEETRIRLIKMSSKPYPAFYNSKIREFVPAGENLARICRERGINYMTLHDLKHRNTKQSQNGWRLATEKEIADFNSYNE